MEDALRFIADRENLMFAECSDAEEIVSVAREALALPYFSVKSFSNHTQKEAMNEKEQKVADALLEKIQSATSANDALQFASAYGALAQGAINRKNAESETK